MSDNDVAILHGELREFRAEMRAEMRALRENVTIAQTVGHPRCAKQDNRLEHLEGDVALCHDRVSAMKKGMWSLVSGFAILAAKELWNMLAKH